jgi:hypothetical protein
MTAENLCKDAVIFMKTTIDNLLDRLNDMREELLAIERIP